MLALTALRAGSRFSAQKRSLFSVNALIIGQEPCIHAPPASQYMSGHLISFSLIKREADGVKVIPSYSDEFTAQVVRKMMPPNIQSVSQISVSSPLTT